MLIVSAVDVEGQDSEVQEGHWGAWQEASPCSVSCGSGSQKIVRTWIPGPNDPPGSGNFTREHVYSCTSRTQPDCPVDGSWSGWYAAGRCSVMCGGGLQVMQRQCMGRTGLGKDCEGENQKSEACNQVPCPVLPHNFNMSSCGSSRFTCASKLMCVPKSQRCDGVIQCHDGSDEMTCPRRSRSRNYSNNAGSCYIQSFQWLFATLISAFLTSAALH